MRSAGFLQSFAFLPLLLVCTNAIGAPVPPIPPTETALRQALRNGAFQPFDGHRVSLTGPLVARIHRGSVSLGLEPGPAAGEPTSTPAIDCVGLMLSAAQFDRVQHAHRVRVRGMFVVASPTTAGGIVTSLSRHGRTIYPLCETPDWIFPFIYVDRVTVVWEAGER